MQETWVPPLGQEDPLEKEMAISVFLPGKSHGQRSLEGHSLWGREESDATEHALTQYAPNVVSTQDQYKSQHTG